MRPWAAAAAVRSRRYGFSRTWVVCIQYAPSPQAIQYSVVEFTVLCGVSEH